MTKKENVRYWDMIDNVCYKFVLDVAVFTAKGVYMEYPEYEKMSVEIGTIVRDIVIERLEKYGYKFPYVDGNF